MEFAEQGAVTKLTGSIVVHGDAPPPPMRKTPPAGTGFPLPKKSEKKIRVRKPNPEIDPTGPMAMMDELQEENENPNSNKPLGEGARRFDFDGTDITAKAATEETEKAGLHNHGDDPDKPGYAVYELALMCRSANASQRAFAFEFLAAIARKQGKSIYSDVQQTQLPILTVSALFKPTNVSIKANATALILELVLGQFQDAFSLVPYPTLPPVNSMTLEFEKYAEDLVLASSSDARFMDCLALFAVNKKFDVAELEKLEPSKHLFRLARSVFVCWGQRFAEKQAYEAAVGSDAELAREAAAVLRFFKDDFEIEFLDKMDAEVLCTVLSRCNLDSKHAKYVDAALKLCPNPFALEFLANCAQKNLISKDVAKQALDKAAYSAPMIALKSFCEMSLEPHKLPTTAEDCWTQRDVVCGMVEYVIKTRDLKCLPELLPCLYSFTNPAADMLLETVFDLPPMKERPIDPLAIFENLLTMPVDKVKPVLDIAQHFPLRFALPVFGREDAEQLSDVVSNFLDNFADPLPEDSIRSLDLSSYFERFLFDRFFVTAFQKLAYFCVSPGSNAEVRQHFWTHCARYLSRFTVPNVRKDVFSDFEEDLEVLASIVQAIKEQIEYSETDILKIAVFQLNSFVKRHKGEHKGMVFFDSIRKLPECWASKILCGV